MIALSPAKTARQDRICALKLNYFVALKNSKVKEYLRNVYPISLVLETTQSCARARGRAKPASSCRVDSEFVAKQSATGYWSIEMEHQAASCLDVLRLLFEKPTLMVMDDCIFCKISRSEIPTHKIYEDDHSFAFLDKHPINPGHTLVIPKFHEANFYQLNENHYSHLMLTVKKLSEQINQVMRPHKVGLIVAGWDIPHAHVHIVPMNDYHDITSKSLLEGKRANPSDAELTKVANSLTSGS